MLPEEGINPNRSSEQELETPEPPPWLDEVPFHLSPDDIVDGEERDLLPSVEEERITVPEIAPAFAPNGPIARALGPRFRYRETQVEMAQLVRQALIEKKTALIEAGTGSGKSFAYLAPLIWSGARVLVSTANKTLQTQLWEKDIPALQRVAPRPFTAALLKGRANYVCLLKLREARQQLALPELDDGVAELTRQLERVPSGDVEDLRLSYQLREVVTAGLHDCLGAKCAYFRRCYYEQAKLEAEEADMAVVNHALLAFNLTRPILSPRPVVVIDEAHELEGYVVNALRLSLHYTTIPQFINDEVVMRHASEKTRGQAVQVNHHLFDRLAEKPSPFDRRWTIQGELQHGLEVAYLLNKMRGQLLGAYPPKVEDEDTDQDQVNARHQRTIEWAETLADHVRYCEERQRTSGPESIVLSCEPLQVADFLHEGLFEPVKRVICTGATLTVDRRFDYFRRQVGTPDRLTIERVLDGPFDYARQALLYTPNGLEPQYGAGEDDYVLRLGREVWRLIQASRGRAFVLCTSRRRMNQLYDLVSPHLDYSCYCQGAGLARAELIERFENDAGGAVLFATRSFWEGVDIPGEALSLVIIDKLPFAPHFDPVVQHRHQLIRDRGGNPFQELTLPEAILALKQGVGRLIRTETDRGVMAILDSRINTRRYGQQIIASLPRARRTRRISDVRAFFAQESV
jgi:Rad3-related DNA helicase